MIRLLLGVAVGYVLGTKAGRRRFEQISRAYRSVAGSPATKKVVGVGRQRLSDALSTQPKLEEFATIDDDTTVYVPREQMDWDARR